MNAEKILMQINSNPVIAAVRSCEELERAVASPVKIIFLLNSEISKIGEYIELCHLNKKIILVHFDLVSGLGNDEEAVRFLCSFNPDGIISTKNNILKIASEQGVFTVQRFFIVDSRSCDTMRRALNVYRPNMVEIMPGVIFKEIERIISDGVENVICGGMIDDKQTVIKLLSVGAVGVSTSHSDLWTI